MTARACFRMFHQEGLGPGRDHLVRHRAVVLRDHFSHVLADRTVREWPTKREQLVK